ncbi:MAG: OOP family OmpA-OmpF porin [Psychromonas sp.]|jgi:OOP family OmpA-OmpF porin
MFFIRGLLILTLPNLNLFAQENLVYNGGFEEYSECPTGNDLDDGQFERCTGWSRPTLGTSDYFNQCATQYVSVPDNFWGHQEPYEGKGYVGFVPIDWELSSGNTFELEYIQNKLIAPLIKCHEYYFEMQVNLADLSKHAFSNIGALFLENAYFQNDSKGIYKTPQILNKEGVISDTVEWKAISGSFIANGKEEYLLIGYFYENVQNDTLKVSESMGFPEHGYGYYYIDNVMLIDKGYVENCVIQIDLPNVFSPNGDGINDMLDFSILGSDENVELIILNRWGEIVYEYSNEYPLWTGATLKGKICSEGTYFYKVRFRNDQVENEKSGFI